MYICVLQSTEPFCVNNRSGDTDSLASFPSLLLPLLPHLRVIEIVVIVVDWLVGGSSSAGSIILFLLLPLKIVVVMFAVWYSRF